jgi:GNAT superfamily N-acetyltransferase
MTITVTTLTGPAVMKLIPDLARLRVEVFREWPYIYEGDLAYEHRYLRKYADLPGATVVVAQDGERVIGASTALPLAKAEAELQAPFLAASERLADWYYFGESVLERRYRGRGLGVKFFDGREARARELGFSKTTFCAVRRPDKHPLKPSDYMPLDAFWAKRGYAKRPDWTAHFSWRDVGEADETEKTMVFWTRDLP